MPLAQFPLVDLPAGLHFAAALAVWGVGIHLALDMAHTKQNEPGYHST